MKHLPRRSALESFKKRESEMGGGTVSLERSALQLKNLGKFAEAAKLFELILEQQPDREHGNALYDLAQCHEDMGSLELAEKYYRTAVRLYPREETFLGGLTSFLYLHGKR